MKTLKILFVDDEPYYTRPYRDALATNGFDVRYTESVVEATTILAGLVAGELDGLVLDLQMPRPESMNEAKAVQYVELTGLWLLGEFAKKIETLQIRVALLTNVNPARFVGALQTVPLRPETLKVFRKIETAAKDFPSKLRDLIQSGRL